MIRWCAYCQTFQGEVPPYDSYDLTHGVCDACEKASKPTDGDAIDAIRPLARFYRELRFRAVDGFDAPGSRILDEAMALGIQPVDLLVGMLQPALAEIGTAWAEGRVSVAIEHRFSAAVESVAVAALARLPRSSGVRQAARPEILLTIADGNFHTLGLKVVELILLSAGRAVLAVAPGLPSSEIIELARSSKPEVLGVSASGTEHVAPVREIAEGLATWPPQTRPRLVVGGQLAKAGLQLEPSLRVEVCVDARALLPSRSPATASRLAVGS